MEDKFACPALTTGTKYPTVITVISFTLFPSGFGCS